MRGKRNDAGNLSDICCKARKGEEQSTKHLHKSIKIRRPAKMLQIIKKKNKKQKVKNQWVSPTPQRRFTGDLSQCSPSSIQSRQRTRWSDVNCTRTRVLPSVSMTFLRGMWTIRMMECGHCCRARLHTKAIRSICMKHTHTTVSVQERRAQR